MFASVAEREALVTRVGANTADDTTFGSSRFVVGAISDVALDLVTRPPLDSIDDRSFGESFPVLGGALFDGGSLGIFGSCALGALAFSCTVRLDGDSGLLESDL